MKKFITNLMLVVFTATVISCGGYFKDVQQVNTPRPHEMTSKSCVDLDREIYNSRVAVDQSKDKVKFRNVCNIIFGVTGVFLFFPVLILIDPTMKDNVNHENRVYEYNWLVDLSDQKGCNSRYDKLSPPYHGRWLR